MNKIINAVKIQKEQNDIFSKAMGFPTINEMLKPLNIRKFKTIEEAENYYMSRYAKTNNMHDEETAKMERWLETQNIEETEEPADEPIDDVERYEAQAEQDKRLNDESKYPNE